jgi:hypothetical protein
MQVLRTIITYLQLIYSFVTAVPQFIIISMLEQLVACSSLTVRLAIKFLH